MKKKNAMILAASIAVLALGFLLLGCNTSATSEVKKDTTELKVDTLKIDTLKVDTLK